ncbi:Retrovirus-related Pol polyprotein LINE-1 [Artemisia annua]|uniref:Retrovirus-related Pol polyprotein LINE-1 n=1 Tax=Artemisia annua TaxID=35608 RepID=A0A2U1N0C5_ARTAN|nr:Retrovirus-related Pol polyprotein LINE-1 [Artemisia annua]
MIIEACNKGIFKGLSLIEDGANISLLQYADDALYFGECISFSEEEVVNIARAVNCSHDSLPFSYLGLFVGRNTNKVDAWSDVVQKFTKRLSSWKENLLSIGGRLTLVKSVLGTLLLNFLSLFKALEAVISNLESIRRRFFWDMKEDENKIVWIHWQKINLRKSRRLCISVSEEEVVNIARAVNCSHDSLPFSYLGLLVGRNTSKVDVWSVVVQKFTKRLSSWKENLLSIGGRLTLVKSVLGQLAWHRQPFGRSNGEISSLLNLLNGLVLTPSQDDKWVWSLEHSGAFTVRSLSTTIDKDSCLSCKCYGSSFSMEFMSSS